MWLFLWAKEMIDVTLKNGTQDLVLIESKVRGNFELVDFDNSTAIGAPVETDGCAYRWNVYCDSEGYSVGRIYNQNGYKQFLYYITDTNVDYEKYLSGDPFLRLTKWEFLCHYFNLNRGHDPNKNYPKKYPCLLQIWQHFEGNMLHMSYFDINTKLTRIKSITHSAQQDKRERD